MQCDSEQGRGVGRVLVRVWASDLDTKPPEYALFLGDGLVAIRQ